MIDKKSIVLYVLLTFAASWAIALPLFFSGALDPTRMSVALYLLGAGLLLVPGATMAMTAALQGDWDNVAVRRIALDARSAAYVILGVPLLVNAAYALSALLGWAEFDPQLLQLKSLMTTMGELSSPTPLSTSFLFVFGYGLTIFVIPVLLLPLALAGELGWRAYLLPKLQPLGRPAAYLILAVLSCLWFLPWFLMDFFFVGMRSTPALILALVVSVCLSVILGELGRRSQGVLLPALFLAAFTAELMGIAPAAFTEVSPGLGGPFGLVGIGMLALLAALLYRWPEKRRVLS